MLPASLLRRIAQLAGVHLYVETEDVVWAARDMVAVCVREAGPREISLPRKGDVRDLYSGAQIGKDIDVFEAQFEDRGTRVFVIE